MTGSSNNIIPNNKQKFIDTYKINENIQELIKIFNVSENTVRYWLKKYGLLKKVNKKIEIINGYKKCTKCGVDKKLDQYPFRNKEKQIYRNECKECSAKNRKIKNYDGKKINKNYKSNAVKYKGGKCEICNLETNIFNIYDFHHMNPSEKEFTYSTKRHIDIEKCKNELDKCHLVCSNCHREIHGGFYPNFLINSSKIDEQIIEMNENTKFCKKCKKINQMDSYIYNHTVKLKENKYGIKKPTNG